MLHPRNKDALTEIIAVRMQIHGPNCDLNNIDVSQIEDFSGLFASHGRIAAFNGDISGWNMAEATTLGHMFVGSPFNGDISMWRPEKAVRTSYMFAGSRFNGDLSNWRMPQCSNMQSMFESSPFAGDVSQWDVANVEYFSRMFNNTPFKGDLSLWDVSNAMSMESMFEDSLFDGDISGWTPKRLVHLANMFKNSPFDHDLSMWPLPSYLVLHTTGMFDGNPKGLGAQKMSMWFLKHAVDNQLAATVDLKLQLAIKKYAHLNKTMGFDPSRKYDDLMQMYQLARKPAESYPTDGFGLGGPI